MRKIIFRLFVRPLKISTTLAMCQTIKGIVQKPLLAKYATIYLQSQGITDVCVIYDFDTDKFYIRNEKV